MIRNWTPEQHERLIAMSKELRPIIDIAAATGKSYDQVVWYRGLLRRTGVLPQRVWGNTNHHLWTADDNLRLQQMVDEGMSSAAIARALGRTKIAVIVHMKQTGVKRRRRREVYTLQQVAEVMGISCGKTVARWVGERGWLTLIPGSGRPRRNGNRRACYVRREDLWSFVENPETFVAWEVERITEPDLRDYAREQRALHPRWLRGREIARRYHITQSAVTDWIRSGILPPEKVVRYGVYWIREDALEDFIPPSERVTARCCGRVIAHPQRDDPLGLICPDCRPRYHELSTGSLVRVWAATD